MKRCIVIMAAIICLQFERPVLSDEVVLQDADAIAPTDDAWRDSGMLAEVRLRSGNGRLLVNATSVGPPLGEVAGGLVVFAGELFSLAIDTDNNPATGTTARFAIHVDGVEWQPAVHICADRKTDAATVQRHCGHGLYDSAEAVSVVKLRNLLDSTAPETECACGEINGSMVQIKIPYESIGVSAGDVIRIYVIGSGIDGVTRQRFESAMLTLN